MPELCKSFPDSSVGKESICNAGETGSVPRLGISTWRRNRLPTPVFLGFPGDSDNKEPACNVGDLGSIPRSGRSPGGGHGNALQFSCLENLPGQRSLVGCSSWGCKESDMTEWLSTARIQYQQQKEEQTISLFFRGKCFKVQRNVCPGGQWFLMILFLSSAWNKAWYIAKWK